MANIWDSIKETGESLGGMAYAPLGVVLDLASAPFDDEDHTFGSLLNEIASRGGDAIDPLMNQETITGYGLGKVMSGLNWTYKNAVDEPLSAAVTLSSHVDAGGGWSSFFSGEDWARAYDVAQKQSLGQSIVFAAGDKGTDPFAVDAAGQRPYDLVAEEHPTIAGIASTGIDLTTMWFADPAAIAGKAYAVARQTKTMGKLTEAEKADLYSRLAVGPNQKTRLDDWLDWTEGKNALGKELTAPEILYGTPELRKYAAEPHVVAGLVADANKITDPIQRRDAKRRIIAVAAGDTTQINRLRDEISEAPALADQLRNMLETQGSINLKAVAAKPGLGSDPAFIAALDKQLANLNTTQDVDKFFDSWNARLGLMLDTGKGGGTLSHLPGAHGSAIPGMTAPADRAINRLNDTGKGRSLKKAHEKIEARAGAYLASVDSTSSVFQKGVHALPLVVVKTVGMPASVYTKFPVKVSDTLRTAHFTGMANLHDWGGSTNQLDSMMKLAGVDHGKRLELLSKAFVATTEPEKLRLIDHAEKLSMKALATKYSQKYGADVDGAFIEELMVNHASRRGQRLAQIKGRAYAATTMSDEMMAMRGRGAQRAEDSARWIESDSFAPPATAGTWRVDQINDDGTLLSLPLLETQLSNTVPLIDFGLAEKVLDREFSSLSRLSRAWQSEAAELTRLGNLAAKTNGGKKLERALEATRYRMDHLVDAGAKALRFWKFSVLFRLGYPLRVLADDHMRIATQLNWAAMAGSSLREALPNARKNRTSVLFGPGTRGSEARRAMHDAKVRRQQILDELDGDLALTYEERLEDLKAVSRSVRAQRGAVTRLRNSGDETKLAQAEQRLAEKEATLAHRSEEMGDFDPDALKRELATLEDSLAGGLKSFLPAKRTIGQSGVKLDDDVAVEGAFAGQGGDVMYEASSSRGTFEAQMDMGESAMFGAASRGAHRTVAPTEPGHADAWADALNYQVRNSKVAMFFVNGGSVDDFVRWIKAPEQADLRRRVPHFAHDPEDWGHRVQALVHDYIPTDELREAVLAGRIKTKFLEKNFADPTMRPAVHGRALADNLGTSYGVQLQGKMLDRVYKMLGEWPTDHLSRHPFFNAMYKQHLREGYATMKAGREAGQKFTQRDLDDLVRQSRKLALGDVKKTLFDISAHSHAAHLMRFVSPFFAAHQEVLARWWRIVGDKPHVVRRFTQVFDIPRHLGLVIDSETGELVQPGEGISPSHRLLLQVPKAWGGPETDLSKGGAKWSQWSISENSFNLILQSGSPFNPGAGPLVTVPVEWAAATFADQPSIARVARVFNPFPPNAAIDAAVPATVKRLLAYTEGKHGISDPLGIGEREYGSLYNTAVQDEMVRFQLENGREPTRAEADQIMENAGIHATSTAFLRILNNAGSPFPANPRSKYAAVQMGWYQISKQGDAEGWDFETKVARFKEKWGEAYLPLIYSASNNPAGLTGTPEEVSAFKKYKGLLQNIDPALTQAVIGPEAEDSEYSSEARNYFRDQSVQLGSSETYFNYDDPRDAMREQMARRGWLKYGELTAALTAQAVEMGYTSYFDPAMPTALREQFADVKRTAVNALADENWAFDDEYNNFDQNKFDRQLADMEKIVSYSSLAKDPTRTDIRVLQKYLTLRKVFMYVVDARAQAGLGGIDAQATEPIKQMFTALVSEMVESNTYFEQYIYNPTLSRDPLLSEEGVNVDDAAA